MHYVVSYSSLFGGLLPKPLTLNPKALNPKALNPTTLNPAWPCPVLKPRRLKPPSLVKTLQMSSKIVRLPMHGMFPFRHAPAVVEEDRRGDSNWTEIQGTKGETIKGPLGNGTISLDQNSCWPDPVTFSCERARFLRKAWIRDSESRRSIQLRQSHNSGKSTLNLKP